MLDTTEEFLKLRFLRKRGKNQAGLKFEREVVTAIVRHSSEKTVLPEFMSYSLGKQSLAG